MSSFLETGRFHVDSYGVEFTAFGVPQPGGSKQIVGGRNGRARVIEDNTDVYAWRQNIAQVARVLMAHRAPFEGPLRLSVIFYMPRPKSHIGKRGVFPGAPKYPSVRPDTTKLLRALEDALNGIVWKDDAQVVDQVAQKRYTPDDPRAVVAVSVKV